MPGESNLQVLLKTMAPKLHGDAFVFLTTNDPASWAGLDIVMQFHEEEGTTFIVKESLAKKKGEKYQGTWAMITLQVHSDLAAVGFTAAIATKLAQAAISINPVAAYYHDHLFVPWEKRMEAMEVLQLLSAKV